MAALYELDDQNGRTHQVAVKLLHDRPDKPVTVSADKLANEKAFHVRIVGRIGREQGDWGALLTGRTPCTSVGSHVSFRTHRTAHEADRSLLPPSREGWHSVFPFKTCGQGTSNESRFRRGH